jgi:branched-chain amino acid transport system substrate-binding protein
LLLKAAADGGLQVDWYAPSSHGAGGPTAIKQSGLADHVFTFVEWNPNGAPAESQSLESAFRDKYHAGFWYPSVANLFQMLSQAAAEAKTTNVKALAASLGGMKAKGFNGDEENTGWGWKTVAQIPAADTVQPNTCRMNRPSQ